MIFAFSPVPSTTSPILSASTLISARSSRFVSAASSRIADAVWSMCVYSPFAVSSTSPFVDPATLAPLRPLFAAVAASFLNIVATSSRLLASVTVTSCGSLILSLNCSRVIRSCITVPSSGTGTWHTVPTTSLSRGSLVSWLSSSPLIVIVTVGSQCLRSRSAAHIRSWSSELYA